MVDDLCEVVRLTEEQDVTTAAGYEYAMSQIRSFGGGHITLWGSIPCARGSPRQYVNEVMYYRSGDGKSLRRLWVLRANFRKLFWAFRDLTDEVMKRMGAVCLEWPTPCRYWRDPQVREYLMNHSLIRDNPHGCAYGLENRKG